MILKRRGAGQEKEDDADQARRNGEENQKRLEKPETGRGGLDAE
jgi:hypothetical protein